MKWLEHFCVFFASLRKHIKQTRCFCNKHGILFAASVRKFLLFQFDLPLWIFSPPKSFDDRSKQWYAHESNTDKIVTSHRKTYTNDFPRNGFFARLPRGLRERVAIDNQTGCQKLLTSGRKFYTAWKKICTSGSTTYFCCYDFMA